MFILACAYVLADWFAERAWQKYLQRLGHAEEISLRPKVPNHLNFAKTPLLEQNGYKDRISGARPPGLDHAERLINFGAVADFRRGGFTHLAAEAVSTNANLSVNDQKAAGQVLAEMEQQDGEINELLEAAKRPYSRFDMEINSDGPVPNFVLLRFIAQVFQYRALCFLALNDPQEAAAQMRVFDQVVEGLRGHPTLVAGMIRVAIIGLEFQPFYEGWSRRQWSPEQYAEFQKMFARAECLENFDFSMLTGERLGVAEFVNTKTPREMIEKINLSGVDEVKEPIRALLMNTYFRSMPKGWWRRNLIEHHRILDGMRTNLYDINSRLVFAQNDQRGINWFDKELTRAKPFHHIAAAAIPNIAKALQHVALAQASSDQAMIVCALERYAAKYSSYPDSLPGLVPEFMVALPKDLISGNFPIYRKKEDGTFLLYSVGWDGRDNSAPAGPNDYFTRGQDFVWPFHRAR